MIVTSYTHIDVVTRSPGPARCGLLPTRRPATAAPADPAAVLPLGALGCVVSLAAVVVGHPFGQILSCPPGWGGVTACSGRCAVSHEDWPHRRLMFMAAPTFDHAVPREVISYSPPGGTFRKGDYPWLVAVRVTLKGGDGGAGERGEPGQPGESVSKVILASDLGEEELVTIGEGGKGASGVGDGHDGYVLVELFDEAL